MFRTIIDNDDIKMYQFNQYVCRFDKKTGKTIRGNPHQKDDDAFWNPYGPELLDIGITTNCNMDCSYCYQNSKKGTGEHISVADYRKILDGTKDTLLQVALGGGEPTTHPDLIEILRTTREDYGVIPNFTTNGKDVSDAILHASARYCGAVACSCHAPDHVSIGDPSTILGPQVTDFVSRSIAAGVKTNLHFVLGDKTINTALDLMGNADCIEGIKGLNAIVFLLYKPVGRGVDNDILKVDDRFHKFIDFVQKNDYPFKIGFDACSVPFVLSYTDFSSMYMDSCEGGRFSCYVHYDGSIKACSFEGKSYGNAFTNNFVSIWRKNIEDVRQSMIEQSNHCKACYGCNIVESCLGGCPIVNQIVLCNRKC